MKVSPHALWVKGLFRYLGEAGCTIKGYVSVPLLECYKDASLFCSVNSMARSKAVLARGHLCEQEWLLMLGVDEYAVVWQNLEVVGVANVLL
eukprot:902470-Pelagomonas_calceolata.AAC.1